MEWDNSSNAKFEDLADHNGPLMEDGDPDFSDPFPSECFFETIDDATNDESSTFQNDPDLFGNTGRASSKLQVPGFELDDPLTSPLQDKPKHTHVFEPVALPTEREIEPEFSVVTTSALVENAKTPTKESAKRAKTPIAATLSRPNTPGMGSPMKTRKISSGRLPQVTTPPEVECSARQCKVSLITSTKRGEFLVPVDRTKPKSPCNDEKHDICVNKLSKPEIWNEIKEEGVYFHQNNGKAIYRQHPLRADGTFYQYSSIIEETQMGITNLWHLALEKALRCVDDEKRLLINPDGREGNQHMIPKIFLSEYILCGRFFDENGKCLVDECIPFWNLPLHTHEVRISCPAVNVSGKCRKKVHPWRLIMWIFDLISTWESPRTTGSQESMPRHHGSIDCNYGYQCLNPLHYVLHMRDDASEEEIQLAQQRLQVEVAERLNKCLADAKAPEGDRGFAGLSDCRCLKCRYTKPEATKMTSLVPEKVGQSLSASSARRKKKNQGKVTKSSGKATNGSAQPPEISTQLYMTANEDTCTSSYTQDTQDTQVSAISRYSTQSDLLFADDAAPNLGSLPSPMVDEIRVPNIGVTDFDGDIEHLLSEPLNYLEESDAAVPQIQMSDELDIDAIIATIAFEGAIAEQERPDRKSYTFAEYFATLEDPMIPSAQKYTISDRLVAIRADTLSPAVHQRELDVQPMPPSPLVFNHDDTTTPPAMARGAPSHFEAKAEGFQSQQSSKSKAKLLKDINK